MGGARPLPQPWKERIPGVGHGKQRRLPTALYRGLPLPLLDEGLHPGRDHLVIDGSRDDLSSGENGHDDD